MTFSRNRSGFTLIELLAATSIMTAVILVVVGLSASILGVWTDSVGRLNVNQEARTTMEALGDDLEAAATLSRGRVWLQVSHQDIEIDGASQRFPYLYLLSNTDDRPRFHDRDRDGVIEPEDLLSGDLCAIVYSTLYRNPFTSITPPEPIVGIYRGVIDPENTFTGALAMSPFADNNDHTLENYFAGEVAVGTDTFFTYEGEERDLDSEAEVPGAAWYQGRDYFASSNVVDFSITFYREVDNETFPITGPSGTGTEDDEPSDIIVADAIYAGPGLNSLPGKIVFADIVLMVVPQEGIRAYQTESDGIRQDQEGWEQMIAQYGRPFTRRVFIVANAGQEVAP
ncbi:MAG: type II secretion system protein J [Opitutales bacterium]